MRIFPPAIIILLISSLVLTIGRGITLPFMTIYLTTHFHLLPKSVGLILGASLTIGILCSFYGGYLVDKFSKIHLIIAAIALFGLSLLSLPWLPVAGMVIVVMALLHSAYAVLGISIKACFAEWLPVDQRIKIFSLNYTLINVGWAIGSTMGVTIASFDPLMPFIISGGLAFAIVITLTRQQRHFKNPPNAAAASSGAAVLGLKATINILRQDRRLIFFTLGGTLSAMVFGQFSGYLSQYLITVSNAEFTYKVIAAIMTTNALVVIFCQYGLSRYIRKQHMLLWLAAGTLFFIIGLLGFMHAGQSLLYWVIAMAIFSLGEIIVIPVEYMFIDFIAPAHLRGSYYGVQNLSNLGGAINPVLCGFLLSYTLPNTMFLVLVGSALLGLLFFWWGHRQPAPASL